MRRLALRTSIGAYSAGTFVERVDAGVYQVVATKELLYIDASMVTLRRDRSPK